MPKGRPRADDTQTGSKKSENHIFLIFWLGWRWSKDARNRFSSRCRPIFSEECRILWPPYRRIFSEMCWDSRVFFFSEGSPWSNWHPWLLQHENGMLAPFASKAEGNPIKFHTWKQLFYHIDSRNICKQKYVH